MPRMSSLNDVVIGGGQGPGGGGPEIRVAGDEEHRRALLHGTIDRDADPTHGDSFHWRGVRFTGKRSAGGIGRERA